MLYNVYFSTHNELLDTLGIKNQVSLGKNPSETIPIFSKDNGIKTLNQLVKMGIVSREEANDIISQIRAIKGMPETFADFIEILRQHKLSNEFELRFSFKPIKIIGGARQVRGNIVFSATNDIAEYTCYTNMFDLALTVTVMAKEDGHLAHEAIKILQEALAANLPFD